MAVQAEAALSVDRVRTLGDRRFPTARCFSWPLERKKTLEKPSS